MNIINIAFNTDGTFTLTYADSSTKIFAEQVQVTPPQSVTIPLNVPVIINGTTA